MAADETRARDPQYLLDLLWRTHSPGTRGPRGSLTVDQVVGVAVRIADEEGIAGVSMRRIAQELGVTTMTLYRYVPSKDDLLDLMFAMATSVPDTSDWPDDWRGVLRNWALQTRQLMLSRPWMLDIPIGAPPMSPNSLAWMEVALAALDRTALNEGDMIGVLLIISGFVLGDTRQELTMTSASARTGVSYEDWGRVYGRMMAKVATDERFPTLAKIARSGIFDNENTAEDDFNGNLDFLLDSVAALIRRREEEGGTC
ncbi:TetR family transcriptional regulator [Streptomyces sp. 3MP-14]|uniref:TetR family transcriptional regulator n=1 Tax=Streptomyces mimosae TaxID=2586635 RepID=A0A5N5ZWG3_9ACTN|nr:MULTISPECIES: TetR/AcrR family transcriptional regulator [Streptomyces]KAB8160143.1 TetR family transcriptional regulator [Streptomyces mimosae]KAB8176688.1 TetR family transcriptional regulator [Streptomyces sp. 3MP-14]